MRARIGPLARSALTDAAGHFELVAVPHVGPMVLTIEKPGYVPWSWRFDGRPTEKEYGMIPVTSQASRIPAPGETPVNASLFRFGVLLPPGSFTADGVAYAGPVTIEHAVILLGNGFVHPFPPNPRMDIAGNLDAISPSDYLWLDVRTPDGRRLTPVGGAAGARIEDRAAAGSVRAIEPGRAGYGSRACDPGVGGGLVRSWERLQRGIRSGVVAQSGNGGERLSREFPDELPRVSHLAPGEHPVRHVRQVPTDGRGHPSAGVPGERRDASAAAHVDHLLGGTGGKEVAAGGENARDLDRLSGATVGSRAFVEPDGSLAEEVRERV